MTQILSMQRYVDLLQSRINAYLLPDTCVIYPVTSVADGSGGWTDTLGDPRQYNGSDNVPCRLDPTRQYRDQVVVAAEITVTDYNLNLPFDADVAINDTVVHGGITYTIKKLTVDQTAKAVKKLYIVAVQ